MTQIPYPDINQSGFFGLSSYVADVTKGWFWLIMILILWVVTFTNSKQFTSSRAFTMASFLSALSAIILAVLNLISAKWAYLLILFIAIGALWMKFEE